MAKPGAAESIAAALGRRLPRLVALWKERSAPSAGARRGSSSPVGATLSESELKAVGDALLRLQRGLTGSRALAGSPYMDDPGLLGAYLLYYWPVSYVQASLVIEELALRPRRVLDLGAGPGPAAAAALDAGAAHVELADQSGRALGLASRVLERDAGRVSSALVDLESPNALPLDGEPYDLVIVGHCLNELWRGREDRLARRAELLKGASRLLGPGGAILVLEPALLETSREAIALRDALASAGHPIVGPCPAARSGPYRCPALASGPDRTCHAEVEWRAPEPMASLAAAAGLDRRSVKYAWFAALAATAALAPAAALSAAQGADRASAVGGAAYGAAPGASLEGRVVSDAMLNKAGRTRYLVCAEGRIAALSAAAGSPEARDSGFHSLLRGDRVRVLNAQARAGGGLGLIPGSSLAVLGRAPEIGV
jgi:SAM-dependent methyltransferase